MRVRDRVRDGLEGRVRVRGRVWARSSNPNPNPNQVGVVGGATPGK